MRKLIIIVTLSIIVSYVALDIAGIEELNQSAGQKLYTLLWTLLGYAIGSNHQNHK